MLDSQEKRYCKYCGALLDVSLGKADPCEVAIKSAKEGPPPEIENTVVIEDIGKN